VEAWRIRKNPKNLTTLEPALKRKVIGSKKSSFMMELSKLLFSGVRGNAENSKRKYKTEKASKQG